MKENESNEEDETKKHINAKTDFTIETKRIIKQGKTDTFDKIADKDNAFDMKRNIFFDKQKEYSENIEERLTAILTEVYKEPVDKLHIKTTNKSGDNSIRNASDTGSCPVHDSPEHDSPEPVNTGEKPDANNNDNPTKEDPHTTKKEGEKFKTASFEQLNKKNRAKSIRQKIFTIGTTLLLTIAFVFVIGNIFFKTEQIIINGNRIYTDEIITEYGKINKGTSLLSLSGSSIENNLTNSLPFVNSVEVKKRFPKTIMLDIKESSTVFYIELAGCYVIVSDGLKIIEITEKVPTTFDRYGNIREVKISGVKRAVVAEKVQFYDADTENRLLSVINAIESSDIANGINRINVESFYDIQATYEDRFFIMMGSMASMDEKLDFTYRIMQKFKPGAGGEIYVDNVEKGYVVPNDPSDLIE